MPFISLPEYIDSDFEPHEGAVADKAAELGCGLDTAKIITRREALKAKLVAYRAKPGVDADLCDILDGLLAAVFDA